MENNNNQPHKEHDRDYRYLFFEFSLVFLAVFFGLLADNFRESRADHQLEKQYMVTLVEDLKADTAEFRGLSSMCDNIKLRMDSVITYMRPPIAKDKVLQYYAETMWLTSMKSFSYNDRTTEQLKSSGAFRLIRKSNVADSIVVYDNTMRGVFTKNYNVLWDNRLKLISMFEQIIDLSPVRYMRTDYANKLKYLDDDFKTDNLSRMQFITNDNDKFMNAYNTGIEQIYFSRDLSNWIKRMNTKAISLIQLIQKEYDIE